jgi:hypothetical protein
MVINFSIKSHLKPTLSLPKTKIKKRGDVITRQKKDDITIFLHRLKLRIRLLAGRRLYACT